MTLKEVSNLTPDEIVALAKSMFFKCDEILTSETLEEDSEDFSLLEDIEYSLNIYVMSYNTGHDNDKEEAIESFKISLIQLPFVDKLFKAI